MLCVVLMRNGQLRVAFPVGTERTPHAQSDSAVYRRGETNR